MIDLFKGFFKRETSSQTAKDRLRLVLMSDHLALAPEIVAQMKSELLAVISRYVEFDPAHADVSFESRESDVAMLASIPILSVRDRDARPPGGPLASGGGNAAAPPRETPSVSRDAAAPRLAVPAPSASTADPVLEIPATALVREAAVEVAAAPKSRSARRRRRRKRVPIAPLPA